MRWHNHTWSTHLKQLLICDVLLRTSYVLIANEIQSTRSATTAVTAEQLIYERPRQVATSTASACLMSAEPFSWLKRIEAYGDRMTVKTCGCFAVCCPCALAAAVDLLVATTATATAAAKLYVVARLWNGCGLGNGNSETFCDDHRFSCDDHIFFVRSQNFVLI